MPKVAQAAKSESPKDFGQCSACLEMTTLADPCCPMAGVIIDGTYTRSEVVAGFGDGEE